MIKWIAIIIFALIGLLDVLLILGSAELERRRNEEARTTIIPQGEWIETPEGTICSNCGASPYDDGEYRIANWHSNYCPHCGVPMRGVANDYRH